MSVLDPVRLFKTISRDIPGDLLTQVFVTGSLAAAYAYRVRLESQAVNTKDADLIVHPAGDVAIARAMAERLRSLGWRRLEGQCYPRPSAEPHEQLRLIRLVPPDSNDYFIELLNVPATEQQQAKTLIPVQLPDGWYALASFRFMGLTAQFRRESAEGLEYAAPEMMALANLLSHPRIDGVRIESGDFEGMMRCAKDLGRVLALAHLAYDLNDDALEVWLDHWNKGLQASFPLTWREHAGRAGAGLRAMLADDEVLEEARLTTEAGLLKGFGVEAEQLRAAGARLLSDAIEPLEMVARS